MPEKQLDMFDICSNKHRGNKQSDKAHARVVPAKKSMRAKILDIIFNEGPQSCEDLDKYHGFRYTTASARLSELKRDGLIEQVARGITCTGCENAIYDLTEKARSEQSKQRTEGVDD